MSTFSWATRIREKVADSMIDHASAWIAGAIGTIGAALVLIYRPYFETVSMALRTRLAALPFDIWAGVIVALLLWVLVLLILYRELSASLTAPESEFQAYGGVKWKVFIRQRYIEQSPYCTCCDDPRALGRTEQFDPLACPVTGRHFNIVVNGAAREVEATWNSLRRYWFFNLGEVIQAERQRQLELHPNESRDQILARMLKARPFNRIPRRMIREIRRSFPGALDFEAFLVRHQERYWPCLVKPMYRPSRFR